MTINVKDKTEKLTLGKYYELRGNFEEIENENGEISYSCDMYRTTDSSKTFDDLYQSEVKENAITYLSNTNYVSNNYNDLLKVNSELAEKYFNSISDTYGVTVEEILKQRAEYIEYLNDF
jgi:hypothetical protein